MQEAGPRVVPEAMLNGVPVLVTTQRIRIQHQRVPIQEVEDDVGIDDDLSLRTRCSRRLPTLGVDLLNEAFRLFNPGPHPLAQLMAETRLLAEYPPHPVLAGEGAEYFESFERSSVVI